MATTKKPIIYQIPVCPFCQRLEIQLELKGLRSAVDFQVIDITRPRPDWLLEKTRGYTALPVLESSDGRIILESLVIMQYLEDTYPQPPITQCDPYRHAVEGMMVALAGDFINQGYSYIMNQQVEQRDALRDGMLQQYTLLNDFLLQHNPDGTWLFHEFGWAEAVFTPFFIRFCFLEYYEGFELSKTEQYQRIRKWQDACIAHPAAQQTSKEEIIKLYYDYAKGAGNGSLLPGRRHSSLAFAPHWRERPWPPRNKYDHNASDTELGL